MSHYVYILQSLKDKKYYIGESSDVNARLLFHNSGKQRSTKNRFTNHICLSPVKKADRVTHMHISFSLQTIQGAGQSTKVKEKRAHPKMAVEILKTIYEITIASPNQLLHIKGYW